MNGLPSITEIYSITTVLSAAELLAFAGGAISLVPPPGANQVIWPLSAMFQYNFGTVDFSSTPVLDLQWHGGGSTVLIDSPAATFIGSGVSQLFFAPGGVSTGGFITSFALGQGLDLVLTAGSFALAGVGAATIGAAGTGYVVGDTGTITTGGGDATYRITSIGAAGAVTGFVITFPGSGYSTGNGQATATGGAQPGVGINFTVDVNSLVNGDGTIKVTTLFQVIDVP